MKNIMYLVIYLFWMGPANAAIIYNFESKLSLGTNAGSLITGFVEIDEGAAIVNTYLSVDSPPTLGIFGAIVSWEYDTIYGTFDSITSSTISHNVYLLDNIISPNTILTEWSVEIKLDSTGEILRLGTNAFGGTAVSLLNPSSDSSTSGTGSFTLATAAVPVPAAIWLLGSGLLGLIGMRKKSSKVSALSA